MPTSHDEAVHDLAQHQSAIMAGAELVLRWAMPGSKIENQTRSIFKSAAAISGPIKVLLAENIKFLPKIEPVSLNLVLNGEIASLRAEIGDEAKIELALEPNLPLIDGDQAMLEDLFRQLALNARAAMRANIGVRVIMIKTWAEGRRVLARIIDNGVGIDAASIRKILRGETFSTKPTGTGHGFENIRRTLCSLNGRMEIDNTDEGTAFTFNFNALPKDDSRLA